MDQSILNNSWTIIFQLLNTVLWIGIIYIMYFFVFKLPKRIKITEEKIDKIESMIQRIENKLN